MTILRAPAGADISTLNTYIAQQENFRRGQLVAIRAKDDVTMLEIDDRAGEKPQTNAVLTIERPPAGATIIGNAEIVIGGTPVMVTAYLPALPAR